MTRKATTVVISFRAEPDTLRAIDTLTRHYQARFVKITRTDVLQLAIVERAAKVESGNIRKVAQKPGRA